MSIQVITQFTIFNGQGPIIPANYAMSGDKVIQVQRLADLANNTTFNFNGSDVTSSFDPIIPSNGTIIVSNSSLVPAGPTFISMFQAVLERS